MKTARIKLNNGFTPYPDYQDSGIEWIGKIPKDWELNPWRSVLTERKEKNSKLVTDNILSVTKDRGVIRYADKGAIGNKSSDRPENYKIVYPNDIVINSMNLVIGSVGIARELGVTSSVYLIYKADKEKVYIDYFHYLIRTVSFQKYIARFGKGIMELRESIKADDLRKQLIAIPPLGEQKKIAEYLDEKTVLIDQIIERKKRLLDLLREKRTAIINQAVTKGLDPNVEFVDSGIEWIGKIPKGWGVRKLKYITSIQASNVDKLTDTDLPSVLLCNYVDVYKNEYIDDGLDFMISTATREQIRKVGLKEGDVLFTKDSETADDIGIPAFVRKDVPNLVSGYHLYVARPKNNQRGEFIFRYLQSKFVRVQFELSANGVTRFGLGSMAVKDLSVILPSIKEQQDIAEYVKAKANIIDRATEKVEQSIEALKEFKSSLISNVVTGKIEM
jgi:type I restriction enzyme S subunit